jgi:hypothetical protein
MNGRFAPKADVPEKSVFETWLASCLWRQAKA